MTRLVWDYDAIKYSIASVCEERSIIATHIKSGNEKEFPTRTAFYGHHLKKNGGWLATLNAERAEKDLEPFTADDFDIADKQVAVPVSHMNHIVKQHIAGVEKILGASSSYGYIGKGASWRVAASTIIEYKGNRKDTIKPLMLDEIEAYLKRSQGAKEVTGLEADDVVIIDCMKNPNLILVGVDKDFMGCEPLNFFNPDKMEKPLRIEGLGKLWIEEKKKSSGKVEKTVRGMGRKWFYFQVLSGDSSDCYKANSACPETPWGDQSAYQLLDPCKTDNECWATICSAYLKLYPEPKEIIGWRGDKITVDARYILQENCTMAHMLRTPDDVFMLEDHLERAGVLL